jgi:hypothetical protein
VVIFQFILGVWIEEFISNSVFYNLDFRGFFQGFFQGLVFEVIF